MPQTERRGTGRRSGVGVGIPQPGFLPVPPEPAEQIPREQGDGVREAAEDAIQDGRHPKEADAEGGQNAILPQQIRGPSAEAEAFPGCRIRQPVFPEELGEPGAEAERPLRRRSA